MLLLLLVAFLFGILVLLKCDITLEFDAIVLQGYFK